MKSTLHTASNQDKLFLGLTASIVLAFICFFFLFKGNDQKISQNNGLNINYEMAKVKSSEILYSLDGREIDRDNQELETVSPAQSTTNQKTKNSKAVAAAAKTIVKKNATVAAAAVAAAKKTAAQQKLTAEQSKYKLQDVKVALDDSKKTETNNGSNSQNNTYVNPVTAETDKKNEDKKDVKSIEQWSKEIFASSDRAIILKFVAAFKNKEITDVEFYSVTNKLLNSTDENKKGFGLYALRATPSLNSYVTLVKVQNGLNTTYQAYVQETLLSYHQTGSLVYLHQALNSNNKQIVLKTIEIVKIGITDIKNGTTSSLVDARYRRDSDFMTFAVQNYQSFIPQLTLLQSQSQQSGDQDIYAAAGQLNQTIQSTAVVASNP